MKGNCTLTLKSACTFWTSADPNSTGFIYGACYPTPPCPGPRLSWWRNKMYSQVVAWILPCGAVCRFCPFSRTRNTECLLLIQGLPPAIACRCSWPLVLLWQEGGLPTASWPTGPWHDKWGQAGKHLLPPDPAAPRWGGDVCSAVGDTKDPHVPASSAALRRDL